ncbi:uncharacterized protein I206_102377 [Kwoniella pini CBS 10737]|uniref:Integrase zinc-binding domain-containing protein n=1 Tax=Kwoniella pini CBS 10737 TaxID=1296096 RepID=A0A1B9I570_9TREE|nr:uncharacterized protein I206_02724 [Kwoniella pini CBS 10737]OCF50669.1 hypothetical protein I206_02724 [Kwoniella pini CBS 10737]
MIVRPPVGQQIPIGMGISTQQNGYNETEFENSISISRSSSQSPPDGIEELWCDQDELLSLPKYDEILESNSDPLFPSPHKFNLMVQDYLKNLSPKKREKALLTQKMYDAVLSVLEDPKDTSTKTAQFRFWAKKMFQLTNFGNEKIVCHDHKPVAVKEQIYEVLCHCHGQAGHGGRDKTSAQVRRYYSWIPKEIIARFVRDCPFCQSRRTQSSAGFSNMSESQAFLISLQTSDTQLANKRPVSLAQARANAAALGHKPHRRASIRTIDLCRSRRGSAVSDDGYIHYDTSENSTMSMGMGMEISGYDGNNDPYIDGLYVQPPPGTTAYEFPGTANQDSNQLYNDASSGNNHPPMPRRASSYHEQSTTFLDVKPPCDLNSMIRRNSESNIPHFSKESLQQHNQHMIYSNPPSNNPDIMGGNQFLSVPNSYMTGGYGSLSRTTSSSSLNSLNGDDSLSIDMGMGYFNQHLQMDSSDSSSSDRYVYSEDMGTGIETKIDEWRENNQIYPISGSTTPLDGNFSFPMNMISSMEVNLFPSSSSSGHGHLEYNSISAPPSTYMLPIPEFNFPNLNPMDEPIQLTESYNDNSIMGLTIGQPFSTHQHQNESDQATIDAVNAVQKMFDQNNIFALGEAAGMSQDQILDIHDIDPNLLNTLSSPNNCNSVPPIIKLDQSQQSAEEINAELEAISILALASQGSSDNLLSSNMTPNSLSQFQVSEESLKHMEFVLSQAVDEVTIIPMETPTVIIEQPVDGVGNVDRQNETIFLFSTDTNHPSFTNMIMEEPKGEFQFNHQEMDFSQWPEFALS